MPLGVWTIRSTGVGYREPEVFPEPPGSAAKVSTSARCLADRSSTAGEPLPICADPFLDRYHRCFGGRLYAPAFCEASDPAVRAATEASPFSRTILDDSAAPLAPPAKKL